MSRLDHWLDRSAVAIAAPRAHPAPLEPAGTALDVVSRSDLLRDTAQRLPLPLSPTARLEPLQQGFQREIPRSTALKTIAAATALLAGVRLTRPATASADTLPECLDACGPMYRKAVAQRLSNCIGQAHERKQLGLTMRLFRFLVTGAVVGEVAQEIICDVWTAESTRREWESCKKHCEATHQTEKPLPYPPSCTGLARASRVVASASAAKCADLAPPPPPLGPPGSDCTPNSCEQVGGVCCGPYTSPEGNGGCVVNCSACINPAVSSC